MSLHADDRRLIDAFVDPAVARALEAFLLKDRRPSTTPASSTVARVDPISSGGGDPLLEQMRYLSRGTIYDASAQDDLSADPDPPGSVIRNEAPAAQNPSLRHVLARDYAAFPNGYGTYDAIRALRNNRPRFDSAERELVARWYDGAMQAGIAHGSRADGSRYARYAVEREEDREAWVDQLLDLNRLFAGAPRLDRDLAAWRSLPEAAVDAMASEAAARGAAAHPYPLAVSFSPLVDRKFGGGGALLEITVPRGTPAIVVEPERFRGAVGRALGSGVGALARALAAEEKCEVLLPAGYVFMAPDRAYRLDGRERVVPAEYAGAAEPRLVDGGERIEVAPFRGKDRAGAPARDAAIAGSLGRLRWARSRGSTARQPVA